MRLKVSTTGNPGGWSTLKLQEEGLSIKHLLLERLNYKRQCSSDILDLLQKDFLFQKFSGTFKGIIHFTRRNDTP